MTLSPDCADVSWSKGYHFSPTRPWDRSGMLRLSYSLLGQASPSEPLAEAILHLITMSERGSDCRHGQVRVGRDELANRSLGFLLLAREDISWCKQSVETHIFRVGQKRLLEPCDRCRVATGNEMRHTDPGIAKKGLAFVDDLASRLASRVQVTTDGHRAYLEAIEGAFGGDVDYAVLHKVYGAAPDSAKGRYSPAECIGIQKHRIEGD